MWNYEAVIKETNDKLIARQEGSRSTRSIPRTAYRSATRRSAFVDRGRGKEVESFLADLQAFLLKGETQARIAATGRRVELGRAAPIKADADHQSRPEPRAYGGPAAGARGHSKGAVALPGSLAAPLADRLVHRRVRQHEGARRRAIARRDAIPADAGAHPRRAGAMVEGRPHHRAAVQRSRAVDGNGERRRCRSGRPPDQDARNCARKAAPISTPAGHARLPR